MHICRYRHDDTLPRRIRELLEDRAFAHFYAEHAERPAPPVAHADEPGLKRLARSLDTVLQHADLGETTRGDPELAEAAAHRVVHWLAEEWARSTAIAELDEEERLLVELRRRSSADAVSPALSPEAAQLNAALETVRRRYPARRALWDHFARRLNAPAADGISAKQHAAARAAFVQAWALHFAEHRRRTEERALLRGLRRFLVQLQRDLAEAEERRRRVRDLFGFAGGFWDLLHGAWQEMEWGTLEEAAGLLRDDPTITALAKVLGRGLHAEPEYETVSEEREIEERAIHAEVLGRSEVEGIRMGHAVESMLPSEAALLSDPDTELAFTKRFADDELLSLHYRRLDEHIDISRRTEQVEHLVARQRGPVIVCIDTSGSMAGSPERVAKAISLAVSQMAVREGRRCYLISFSTEIRTLEISDLPRELPALSDFLAHSFHGGTDLRPALREALRMLERERFRRADVLTVSDFRVPKIADRFGVELQRARDRYATIFHSLTVNPHATDDPLHLFDLKWHYDISHPESAGVVLGRFAGYARHEKEPPAQRQRPATVQRT